VVATYNREKVLPIAVEYAVQQTRQPLEIVIVDASEHWESTCDRVLEIVKPYPQIALRYVPAEVRSSSRQRNQALRLATADVVFMLDDDTFLYPDCAEQVMQVYESDEAGKIAGVMPGVADAPPDEVIVADSRKQTGGSESLVARLGGFGAWVWKYFFLMNIEVLWIPYEQQFPQHTLPASVKHLNVGVAKLLHGWRATYRRSIISAELYEPILINHAIAADLDASYRVSRHGALVEIAAAQAYHFYSRSGRITRVQENALSVVNQALYLKKNSDNLDRDRVRFAILNGRRLVADLCKDLLSRRWTFPQVRGLLLGLWYSPAVFRQSVEDLVEFCPQLQKRILQR
jgi:glycosyltransferase involved in cell wall biosynthesis